MPPYDTAGAYRGNAYKTTQALASYDADARAALDFLKGHAACMGDLGVLGMCLGGHLAFRAAMNPDVQAGVCFYATDIHTGSLGEPWRNGCMVSILTHNGLLLSDYFSQPAQWDSGNHPDHKFFCMVAAGVMLLFVVGARTPPATTRSQYLKRREPWQIRAEEIKGYPPLWAEFQGWARINGFNL